MIKLKSPWSIIVPIIIILAIIIIILYFLAIPRLIDIEQHRPQIEKAVEERIDLPLTLGKMETSLTADLGIRVRFKSIDIKHSDQKDFISTGPVYIEIALPSLLRKKVVIREIKSERPTLYLARLQNGKFDIEQLIPERKERPEEYEVIFRNTNIIINNYRLYFKDQFIEPAQSYTIIGQKIRINDLDPDKFIRVAAKGQIVVPNKTNTIFDFIFATELPIEEQKLWENELTLKGEIKNIYPDMYLPYINKYTPYQYSAISGLGDLEFNINMTKSRLIPNTFSIESTFRNLAAKNKIIFNLPNTTKIILRGNVNRDSLVLRDANIRREDVRARLQGNINNYRTRNRILDLRLNVDRTRISSLVSLFPQGLNLPTRPLAVLQKYNVKGNLWVDVAIKGKPQDLDLFGNLRFNEFSMIVDSKKIPKGSGRVDFKGKTYAIDARAFVDPTGFIKTTGTITPSLNKLNLNVISNSIDLAEGKRLLLAISDIFGFPLGPVAQIAASGRGKIDINVSGPFDNINLQGYLNFINALVSHPGLSKNAHDVVGFIRFRGNRVIYDNIKGFIEQSRVIANGYSTLDGFSNVKLTFSELNLTTAHQLIQNSRLLVEVQSILRDVRNTSGIADVIIYLTGGPRAVAASGNIIFQGASLSYAGLTQPIRDLVGQLRFDPQGVFLNSLRGRIAQSPITAEGTVRGAIVNINISSPRLDLFAIRQLILTSPFLVTAKDALQDFTSLSGFADTRLKLAGRIDEELFQTLQLDVINAVFQHRQAGFPARITGGRIFLTQNAISFRNIRGVALGATIRLTGIVTGLPAQLNPQLNIIVRNLPFNRIRQVAQSPLVTQDIRQILDEFTDLRGQINANIRLLPQTYSANIGFNETFAIYQPADLPIEVSTGNLIVTPQTITLENLYTILSNSFVYLDGLINNYRTEPVLDLLASARVSSDDIDEYINQYLEEPIVAEGAIPITALAQGQLDDWRLSAQMTLPIGTSLYYREYIGLPQDRIRVASLNAEGTLNRIEVENLEIAVGDDITNVGLSASPLPNIATNLERLLAAQGTINELQTEEPVFENFIVTTPNPLDITLINPVIEDQTQRALFTSGEFTARALLEGNVFSPQVTGNAALNDVLITTRQTLIDYANLEFNVDNIILTDSNINIAGSPMRVAAIADTDFTRPVTIQEMSINSSSFNVDEITEALRQPEEQITREEEEIAPIVVNRGILVANELIIGDLITTNFSSCFNFGPDWILNMPNIAFESSGGQAEGRLSYNIQTTELISNLAVHGMQANAVATTFLSTPNEVYGTLEGTAEFRTRGRTRQELIANADGFADFLIVDGRLVRLGSLEYLLRAANILQSGITGLTLNNIIDVIAPRETGTFEELGGTLTALDGILTTDNLSSRGENLSLFLEGEMDMLTNYADITILGRLSRRIAGLLGPIGNISIGTFIDIVPGTEILDIIPGLGLIPFLGLGEEGERFREFIVEIEGNLYDPNAVRNFYFVD